MVYEWKDGAHSPKGLDSQIVGDYLEALRAEHGGLSAAIVHEAARPEDSPIHKWFEWDDASAAGKYRLVQARELLRAIVVMSDDAERPEPIRAFVIVGEVGDLEYDHIYVVMSDEEKRRQLLERAIREIRQLQHKYAGLKELASVFAAAEGLQAA